MIIRKISEESCDTEVMAAENLALHHRNKLCFKILKQMYQLYKIYYNIAVFTKKKNLINATSGRIRDLIQKH